MGFGFLKNIFSISEYSDKRNLIKILGIKIKVPKKHFSDMRKQSPYYYYKKHNIDITTLPKATGQIRDVQLAILALLKDFDVICKQNNLHYWIDFGTLLGAVRHKGFIPWDDDIDICMFREDYEKVVEILNSNEYNKDIYADYYRTYLKVMHRECKELFIDIFPVDKWGEIIPLEDQLKESKKIKKISENFHKNDHYINDFSSRIVQAKELMQQIVSEKYPEDINKTMFVWGLDFNHAWKNWFAEYNEYFPFKTIEFEGYEFSCMNQPEKHLRKIYGDFMQYPKKISIGHNAFCEFSEDKKKVIEKLKG